jgi:PAS domain S-box-containing protein
MSMERLDWLEREREALFNNAPCGYHAVDENGIIIEVNNTLLTWLGFRREEVVGKMGFGDIVADGDLLGQQLSKLTAGMDKAQEIVLLRKDRTRFPVLLGLVSIGTKQLFSTIDNSVAHETMERLRTINQELEAFSYSISHDLRAPLRSIDGYSKILHDDYAGQLDDEGRRVLNVVMSNARRMEHLIDDLLDFAKLGRKLIQKTTVDMTGIAKGVVEQLREIDDRKNLDVVVNELHSVYADPEMMRQVWFNLLGNAFKFTSKRDAGRIEVSSYPLEGDEICFQVSDNGVGFDMRYADKLFGVFQRLHKIQDFSGTGVGLAIVKRIVSRHGGRVWADGKVGVGATFGFVLAKKE